MKDEEFKKIRFADKISVWCQVTRVIDGSEDLDVLAGNKPQSLCCVPLTESGTLPTLHVYAADVDSHIPAPYRPEEGDYVIGWFDNDPLMVGRIRKIHNNDAWVGMDQLPGIIVPLQQLKRST